MGQLELPRSVRRVAELAYLQLNTPKSLAAWLLLRHKEWGQLARLRTDPSDYLDNSEGIERYRRDAQAADLLRKYDGFPTPKKNRVEAAIKTFHESEERCLDTNEFLQHLESAPTGAFDYACIRILRKARNWMKRVLGSLPPSLEGRYGPGTTFETESGEGATLADKFWKTPHVTQHCHALFEHAWTSTHVARRRVELGLDWIQYARGNRFTTVPKDANTDRGICIEPSGNLFCQLGIGKVLKSKLASIGIDVGHNNPEIDPLVALQARRRPVSGQLLHRHLARDGSISGEVATIDLSSASDTVSYRLVKWLLPRDWFSLCDAARSPLTRLQGKWHHLQKFSSMGNGFTFELETLIFCALIHAVTGLTAGEQFWVYGDDILIPSSQARDVLACLRTFGFLPNPRKTFTTGFFRESCGGDYYRGVDVRPFFLKKELVHPCEWYVVYNELMRRGLVNAANHVLFDILPKDERRFGPGWLGHSVLHSDDRNLWKCRHKDGITWVYGRSLSPVVLRHDRWSSGMLLSLALYGVPSSGLSPAREICGMRTVRFSVS